METKTSLTIDDYLDGQDIFSEIDLLGMFPFIDENTGNLFSTQFGNMPLYSRLENQNVHSVAIMIVAKYGDKWKRIMEAKGLDFGAERTRIVNESRNKDESTTSNTVGKNKVSAYNSESLIDDTGNESDETGTLTNTAGREMTDSTITVQGVYDSLTLADKLHIINVALNDVASFMKLDVY